MRPVLLLIALMLVLVPSASAQLGGEDLPPGVSQDDIYRVSSQMYCEVCEGVAVSNCPSPTCRAWRQEIAELMGEGLTDEEIMETFATLYGDEISGVPIDGSERNFALYLPIALIVVAGVAVLWKVWDVRGRGDSRAMEAAKSAGLHEKYDRPVPDNVASEAYLEKFLELVEKRA